MATAYKTQQIGGTSGTATFSTLYSTGASTTAVVSAIHICNESATAGTAWIGLVSSAVSPGSGEFLAVNWTIPGYSTVTWNGPVTLGNTEFIRVSSNGTAVTFTAAVAEVS
jgi:hypothetical protein